MRASPEQARPSRQVDVGRLAAMALMSLGLVGNAVALAGRGTEPTAGAGPLHLLVTILSTAFYAAVILAYLRRGPAAATTRTTSAYATAFAASLLPMALPAFGYRAETAGALALANVLLALGLTVGVWGVLALDRSFSVVPQARSLVTRGPYAWVRHPIYLGELVASLGVTILVQRPAAALVWVLVLVLQYRRTVIEERLLRATLPAYADYAAGVGRLLPRPPWSRESGRGGDEARRLIQRSPGG